MCVCLYIYIYIYVLIHGTSSTDVYHYFVDDAPALRQCDQRASLPSANCPAKKANESGHQTGQGGSYTGLALNNSEKDFHDIKGTIPNWFS